MAWDDLVEKAKGGKAPAKPRAKKAKVDASPPPEWKEAVEFSAARDHVEDHADEHLPPYERIRREAERAYGPGHMATLLWIDDRCQAAGMHPLGLWWISEFRRFYATGKLVFAARVGLRGVKSESVAHAILNDAVFGRCSIGPSTIRVIPIMSSDRTDATDRFHTIQAILAAIGVVDEKSVDEGTVAAPGGIGATYKATTLPSGGGVIKVDDCEGREVQIRVYPARLTGVIGHTDKAGFGDEIDTWPVDLGVADADVAQRSDGGKANPGDVVLDRWLERFTTTMDTAHLYLVSASYFGPDTAHARKIREGDTALQMVARLGERGAAEDTAARQRLAKSIGSDDPRLLAPADPMSTDVPAWVTNPGAPIERCYALSKSRIGAMLGRYGGRPDESTATKGPLASTEFQVDNDNAEQIDVVVGVAPGRPWGKVTVALCGDAFVVVSDEIDSSFHLTKSASVYACATAQEPALRAEVAAWLSGRSGEWLPPVAPQNVYDGAALRLAPLATLYERGRLRHVRGLAELETELRSHHAESDRNPRLEALLAAVTRLVACYPWAASTDTEPMRGPVARLGFVGARDDPLQDPRPAWAR